MSNPLSCRLSRKASGIQMALSAMCVAALLASGQGAAAAPGDIDGPIGTDPDATPGAGAGPSDSGSAAPFQPMKFAVPPAGGSAWPRGCSARDRLCVRAPPGTPTAVAASALVAAERSWETLTQTVGLPAPEGLPADAWQLYLIEQVDGDGTAQPLGRDPLSPYDRAASFGLVDRHAPAGCALDLAMARAVARGALWRAAPAMDEASARAQADVFAQLSVPCATGSEDRATFQAAPERCIVDPRSPSFDRGASLFFEWLDRRWPTRPAALVLGLSALSPTRTPATPARLELEGGWDRSPTYFDVLRVSTAGVLWPGSTLDDVLVQFAVDRATGPYAPPPPANAWRVPWPSRARRLASPVPIAPTGESVVVVEHAGAKPGARLRIEAEWEDYARMRWTVVKLDAAGAPIAQLAVPSTDRATRASISVEAIDTVDRLLVIAVGVGSTEHPFDPNQGEWEPHGWLLTVAAE